MFVARLVAAVKRLAVAFDGQTVLVISHGGAIGSLERFLGLKPDRPAHLGGRWIDASPGEPAAPGAAHFVFPPEESAEAGRPSAGLGEATEIAE